MLELFFYSIVGELTVANKQRLCLAAPQHPKNVMMMTRALTAINT